MKRLLTAALLAVFTLSGCEKWSHGPDRDPIDETPTYNEIMQQTILDSLAINERIKTVTFMQPDSTYLFDENRWSIGDSDWRVSLFEDVRSYATICTLDVTPEDERLQIHHERYHFHLEDDVDVLDSTVTTVVTIPYEAIDSVLVLVCYSSTEMHHKITQEVDETLRCPSYMEESQCIRTALQIYLNTYLVDVMEAQQDTAYP